MLVDDEVERLRFLANLVNAIDDPQGRVLVLITLRADAVFTSPSSTARSRNFSVRASCTCFPSRPTSSKRLRSNPPRQRGVTCEPALLAELLTDVIGEPGALPVFQYALTELFDRREGHGLTLATYRSMGGARGVLSRPADDLYHRMTLDQQEAARQLFLRLVTITEHERMGSPASASIGDPRDRR